MKQLTFKEAMPLLMKNEQAIKIAKDEIGLNAAELEALLSKDDAFSDKRLMLLHDALLEVMLESEGVDYAEIECLSSYSTTSVFDLRQFGGVYFITNFEQGDLGYFTSIEDAKKAAKKEYGFDWDNPEAFGMDIDEDKWCEDMEAKQSSEETNN